MVKLISALLYVQIAFGQTYETHTDGNETLLHALTRIGKANNLALGIIEMSNQALCKPLLDNVSDRSSDLLGDLNRLVVGAGYEARLKDGVVTIQPYVVPTTLSLALNHQFTVFPELKGTMQYMGMVLEASLAMSISHASGYAIDSVNGSEAQELMLQKTLFSSTAQIASQIIQLGPKGVWISYEESQGLGKPTKIHLETYSYTDNLIMLEHLTCQH